MVLLTMMMRLFVPLLLFGVFVAGETELKGDDTGPALNAANSLIGMLDVTGSAVPFVPIIETIFSSSISILGGYRMKKIQQAVKKIEKKLDEAFKQLNERLNALEELINDRFKELKAFIARKQFETDVTDPATILYEQAMAFMTTATSNNDTYNALQTECIQQTPWKIAMKIHNRLYGPDNMIMSQLQEDRYSNSSFTKTKDLIMYRMFQLMSVQSVCLGLRYGSNYNVSEDWEMQRIGGIYDEVVQNIVDMRKIQERDYFQLEIHNIVKDVRNLGPSASNVDAEKWIRNKLLEYYPWDNFFVDVTEMGCDERRGFFYNNTGLMRSFYFNYKDEGWPKAVRITRYWARSLTPVEKEHYKTRIIDAVGKSDADTREMVQQVGLADSSSVALVATWHDECVLNSSIDVSGYNQATGIVALEVEQHVSRDPKTRHHSMYEIFALPQRPGSVEYDLGFWVRDAKKMTEKPTEATKRRSRNKG